MQNGCHGVNNVTFLYPIFCPKYFSSERSTDRCIDIPL